MSVGDETLEDHAHQKINTQDTAIRKGTDDVVTVDVVDDEVADIIEGNISGIVDYFVFSGRVFCVARGWCLKERRENGGFLANIEEVSADGGALQPGRVKGQLLTYPSTSPPAS